MSTSRKPAPLFSQGLAEFIKQEIKKRGTSLRAAALGIGISHSHLSDILAGKKTPDAGVCNAIASFFNKPRVEIYRLAGWFDAQENPDELMALRDMAESESEWSEWNRVYESIGDTQGKKGFLNILSYMSGKGN